MRTRPVHRAPELRAKMPDLPSASQQDAPGGPIAVHLAGPGSLAGRDHGHSALQRGEEQLHLLGDAGPVDVDFQPPIGVTDDTGWHLTAEEDAQLETTWITTLARIYDLRFRGACFYPANALEFDFCTRCLETGTMGQAVGGYYLTEKGLPFAEYAYKRLQPTENATMGNDTSRAVSLLLSITRLLFWTCFSALRLTAHFLIGLISFVVGLMAGYRTFRR